MLEPGNPHGVHYYLLNQPHTGKSENIHRDGRRRPDSLFSADTSTITELCTVCLEELHISRDSLAPLQAIGDASVSNGGLIYAKINALFAPMSMDGVDLTLPHFFDVLHRVLTATALNLLMSFLWRM